jgi:hypothetical protein
MALLKLKEMFDDCIVLDARLIEIFLNSQTLLLISQTS